MGHEPRVTLCPLCATEKVMLILSYEGTASPGANGPSIDGRMLAFSCEHGHVFLRISAAANSSQSSPSWEINISAEEVDQRVATRRWFGTPCTGAPRNDDWHVLKFAVALEAMSNSVEQIHQVVGRVWERSLSDIQAEAIAATGTDGSGVRKAKHNENRDCGAHGSGLSERKNYT